MQSKMCKVIFNFVLKNICSIFDEDDTIVEPV